MCSAAACVTCVLMTASYDERDAFVASLTPERLDRTMEIGWQVYDKMRGPARRASPQYTTHAVMQHILAAGPLAPLTVGEVGGFVGRDGGEGMPSLCGVIAKLLPGQAAAYTVRGHTMALGCDGGGGSGCFWALDSAGGKLCVFGSERRALLEHATSGLREDEAYSGTLFTSVKTRTAGAPTCLP